jgi:hypothetical protein
MLSPSLGTLLGTLSLHDLFPVTYDPFPTGVNRRTIVLNVGSFELK